MQASHHLAGERLEPAPKASAIAKPNPKLVRIFSTAPIVAVEDVASLHLASEALPSVELAQAKIRFMSIGSGDSRGPQQLARQAA